MRDFNASAYVSGTSALKPDYLHEESLGFVRVIEFPSLENGKDRFDDFEEIGCIDFACQELNVFHGLVSNVSNRETAEPVVATWKVAVAAVALVIATVIVVFV